MDNVAAELRWAASISAKASVLSAVNCIERDSPAISINATTSVCGSGANAAQAMIDNDAMIPLMTRTVRKPKRRSVGVVTVFIEITEEISKDHHAGIDGAQAEADLERSGKGTA